MESPSGPPLWSTVSIVDIATPQSLLEAWAKKLNRAFCYQYPQYRAKLDSLRHLIERNQLHPVLIL